MTTRPWMPLYVGDYLADTTHLNAAESGAYLHLIMHYWLNAGLPDDDRLLARVAKMTAPQWKTAKPVIQKFFADGWKHKRIEFELTEAARISAAGRAGGKASAEARRQRSANDPPTTDERSFNDCGNDPPTKPQPLHLPSQEERKEDTADAVPSSDSTYAFENGIIRLTQKDFDKWKQAFSYLDLRAELIGLTEWAGQQPRWFFAVSSALAKRNREVKAAAEKKVGFKWNGIEGVI